MMTFMIFYYQHTDGSTKLVTVPGNLWPNKQSALWHNCNTSVLCLGSDYGDNDEREID
jgi:hypothetical protein